MHRSQVNLKDPLLAGVLAFLVPGLGHLYQGRRFKAAIYSLCIISLYLYGLSLSNWKIVQYRGGPGEPRTELLSFMAQCGVGLPGLFAVNQSRRFRRSGEQIVTSLREPFSAPFAGTIEAQEGEDDLQGEVAGTIELAPVAGRFNDAVIVGKINGTTSDGREVSLALGEGVRLGPELRNDPQRFVEADIIRESGKDESRIGQIANAHIPRSFWNWFAIPLTDAEEQDLHRELGKLHELALVFTMIAGLLNILAVWDAVDGPAYGYGLEPDPRAKGNPAATSAASSAEPASQEAVTAGATS